ncbi:MAG: O-antigen ligase family protein [Candidatus Yanofskybacteria bacterium]|nr:O-antigen ligase family protein [Candidatus Yanofskybacteria bacterium]
MKRILSLNRIFIAYALVFTGILTGVLPREAALAAGILLGAWMLWRPLEEGTLLFVRCIPLFIALPLTATYDNLTLWRPLALVLLLRAMLDHDLRTELRTTYREATRNPNAWLKSHPVARRLGILLVLAGLSLIGARYPLTGAIRIIYFVNLSIVPVLIAALVRQRRISAEQVLRAMAIPTMIVIAVGYLQLATTYLMDVYQFMRLWGEEIQLRQFGLQWSRTAVEVGNTWLAYYGDQLSLRVFSLFPDSHSFPTFILLGIPALLAGALGPIVRAAETLPVRRLFRTVATLSVLWIPAAYLIAILSGTRGIWVASVGVVGLVPIGLFLMRRTSVPVLKRRVFAYGASFLIAWFLLFAVAWPIFISPQFLVGKADIALLGHRLRSVIDLGETSNALRLAIWRSSITSIARHPLLGVGIGNFPVVLDQDIRLARAGSTAHNLYLHIAAEMGVLAALESILLLASAWYATWRWFIRAEGAALVYASSLLLYLPWVLAYVLTDPIIFDERVFLFFATILALVWEEGKIVAGNT